MTRPLSPPPPRRREGCCCPGDFSQREAAELFLPSVTSIAPTTTDQSRRHSSRSFLVYACYQCGH